jgi:hypothetical protein
MHLILLHALGSFYPVIVDACFFPHSLKLHIIARESLNYKVNIDNYNINCL